MHSTDQAQFTAILDDLAGVFGKQLTNAVRTLYWDALKDLALSTVQVMAKHHAKRGRFFPKPMELRPAEAQPATQQDERSFREGEARAHRNLEEIRREKGEEAFKADLRLRWADRIIAAGDPSSLQYAEALKVVDALRPLVRGY